jgi:hypothetical protein
MWRHSLALVVALGAAIPGWTTEAPDLRGHLKLQSLGVFYPDDSLLSDVLGDRTLDLQLDGRLVTSWDLGAWDVAADAQLVGQYGDAIEATRELPAELQPYLRRLPDDALRVADLTHELTDRGRGAAVIRLDRLSVGFTGTAFSFRLGRQAISWGNGLIYNPMDIVNPFDPAAVDTEYKTGDDMITAQWLMPSGNDLQAVVVGRRDPGTGEVSADAGTAAVKLHLFAGAWELDLLAAEHWDDPVLAVGAVRSIGGGGLARRCRGHGLRPRHRGFRRHQLQLVLDLVGAQLQRHGRAPLERFRSAGRRLRAGESRGKPGAPGAVPAR